MAWRVHSRSNTFDIECPNHSFDCRWLCRFGKKNKKVSRKRYRGWWDTNRRTLTSGKITGWNWSSPHSTSSHSVQIARSKRITTMARSTQIGTALDSLDFFYECKHGRNFQLMIEVQVGSTTLGCKGDAPRIMSHKYSPFFFLARMSYEYCRCIA